MEADNYVLSFSGGKTSAYMTWLLIQEPKHINTPIIFANTGKEDEATLRFVDNCNEMYGGNRVIWIEYRDNEKGFEIVDFETASRNGEPYSALIKKRKFVPNRVTRFCTQELKIRPMKKFCQNVLGWKHWINLVGIRYDEPRRHAKIGNAKIKDVFEVEHPLFDLKVTKEMVNDFWNKQPFNLELKPHEGNCDLCFLKGIKKKQAILREHPEKANWWINEEMKTSTRFHNDYSFKQLLEFIRIQPQLFGIDDSIEDCFCNVD
jgi:3'-phosphoadenosine 5'-phosphosulfate sulfotransferase (PAPS reductase)/FAD synthetase